MVPKFRMNSMDPKQFKHFEDLLAKIPLDIWRAVKLQAKKDTEKWVGREWWHNKYYHNNPPNDGTQKQRPLRQNSKPECPYYRKLFYPCPEGRYSLGENYPVAYFAKCCIIGFRETTKLFRDDYYSMEEMDPYLDGRENSTPGYYAYPLNIKIANETILLDLTQKSNPLIKYINEAGKRFDYSNFSENLTSKDKGICGLTQLLSITAHKECRIDGIVYKSAQAFKEISGPKQCLVMFNEKKVTEFNFTA